MRFRFEIGDYVFLEVLFIKFVMRFQMKWKPNSQFIRPFEIIGYTLWLVN